MHARGDEISSSRDEMVTGVESVLTSARICACPVTLSLGAKLTSDVDAGQDSVR